MTGEMDNTGYKRNLLLYSSVLSLKLEKRSKQNV